MMSTIMTYDNDNIPEKEMSDERNEKEIEIDDESVSNKNVKKVI